MNIKTGLSITCLAMSMYASPAFSEINTQELNFENGLGNWSNNTGTHQWTINTGQTPSSSTGPISGSNSSTYAYLETSNGNAYSPGNTAILSTLQQETIKLVNFDFHMFGNDIGQLLLEEKDDMGNWNYVWSIAGPQHSDISQAYSSHEVAVSSKEIRFKAVAAGGWQGDIAIDNIKLALTPRQTEFSKIEYSFPNIKPNQIFTQSLDELILNIGANELTYTALNCPAIVSISDKTLIVSATDMEIGEYRCDIMFDYPGLVLSDGQLISANFTFNITNQQPSVVLNVEDFESDILTWSNNTLDDTHNLTIRSGTTPSNSTGPESASSGIKYAYLETSSGSANTAGNNAILTSPVINGEVTEFAFLAHMYGENIGTLVVETLINSDWVEAAVIDGQQQLNSSTPYALHKLNLEGQGVTKIRLKVIAAGGWKGDIAIDNIEIKGYKLESTDTDNDGMPDAWELQYNLNPYFDDSQGDPDSDGTPNINEYLYGSDPQVPDTAFLIPAKSVGTGDDGGANQNWKLDGSFQMNTSLTKVIIEKYRSLDFTKKLQRNSAVEFEVPVIDYSLINSAVITATIEGYWSSDGFPVVRVFEYTGDGFVDESDLLPQGIKVADVQLYDYTKGSKISIDVTDYIRNLDATSNNNIGFMFDMFSFGDRVDITKDFELQIQ